MYDILVVFVHLIVTVFRFIKSGGLRAVVAESVLTRHQILILNRAGSELPVCTSPTGLSPVYAPFSCASLAFCDVAWS